MKLKRRTLLAAAASSAAAIVTSARATSRSAPVLAERASTFPRPHEFDLADPASAEHWADRNESMFVQLEELYPDDPGQLSGCALYINAGGRDTALDAGIAYAPQGDGFPGCHFLGYLNVEELQWLAEQTRYGMPLGRNGGSVTLCLHEMYPQASRDVFSGAALSFSASDGAEMRLCFGSHCLGVLRGRSLTAFCECLRRRLALEGK